jgi:hypothetical protein
MTGNPFQHSVGSAEQATSLSRLERARVVSSKSHVDGDGVGHVIEVRSDFYDQSIPAQLLTSMTGSAHIPEAGQSVLLAYRTEGYPIALGTIYDEKQSPPSFDVRERVVGNGSGSEVRIKPNGDIHVLRKNGPPVTITETAVSVGDGNQGVVTDVDFASETVSRSDTLFVP